MGRMEQEYNHEDCSGTDANEKTGATETPPYERTLPDAGRKEDDDIP